MNYVIREVRLQEHFPQVAYAEAICSKKDETKVYIAISLNDQVMNVYISTKRSLFEYLVSNDMAKVSLYLTKMYSLVANPYMMSREIKAQMKLDQAEMQVVMLLWKTLRHYVSFSQDIIKKGF